MDPDELAALKKALGEFAALKEALGEDARFSVVELPKPVTAMEPDELDALVKQLEEMLVEKAILTVREMRSENQYLWMVIEAVHAGLDYETFRRVTGADCNEDDITQLAKACLELRGPRRLARDQKGTALITYLIHFMLWRCLKLQRLPPALVFLYDDHFQVHKIASQPRGRRYREFRLMVRYYRNRPTASITELANIGGVDRRTARRWLTSGALASGVFPMQRKALDPKT